jgi:hypothetical protein
MPIILTTWRLRLGGMQFKASPGKQFKKLHLQNNQSKMDLEVWLKQYSACFESLKL